MIKSDHGLKQLDGGGPGMTDSSSEEEDEEEDQLGRFVNLEDERVEDAEVFSRAFMREINLI